MELFIENYDPGFLNVQGFGQSATNPLRPVYYEALGIVKDLSVYNSIYAAKTINAGLSFKVGGTSVNLDGATIAVPTTFLRDVTIENNLTVMSITSTKRLIVNGREYVPTTIVGRNGTFTVLASS
jgi:hypothetical protein